MNNIRHSTSDIRHSSTPHAIILAAGLGKRMGGDQPKVVFPIGGEPMVRWVVRACEEAGVSRVIVVVGHKGEQVRAALSGFKSVVFVEQHERLGTGHATQQASSHFDAAKPVDVFVLAGDGPLIRAATLRKLLEVHRATDAAATLATALLDDPTGYGRVIRDAAHGFEAIVEQKDATPAQLAVREVNPSYYCFRSDALFEALSMVRNDNKQGEYYLTDAPGILKQRGRTVSVVDAVPAQDVLSINTLEQLAAVDRVFRRRRIEPSSAPTP